MESFGLLKILQSALSAKEQSPSARQESEPKKSETSTTADENDCENAFVQLMRRHETLSKNIDRRRGK